MFSKHVIVCDSSKANVLAILKRLRYFSRSIYGSFIVESDSSNVIYMVPNWKVNLWEFQSLFNEIRDLALSIDRASRHESRSANFMANTLSKKGVERMTLWEEIVM